VKCRAENDLQRCLTGARNLQPGPGIRAGNMSAAPPVRAYRFGVFEADRDAATLRKDGRDVRLRGKPFDILLFLLERPGELVARDALRHHLWSADTFVDFDHGLNAAMNRLRDALGDTAENPRFVQTIPRRGYRFIAPVERIERPAATMSPVPPVATAAIPGTAPGWSESDVAAPASTTPSGTDARRRRPWLWAAAAAALLAVAATALAIGGAAPGWRRPAGAGRPMIAVLPFENLSGSPDQDYFSDGFTDELIAQLGALNPEALGVIARTTVARYREVATTVQEVGRTLGVQYVLEGSIRRAGDHVRITAQLIDVGSQTQLWAESYDHDVRDVLLTQRDVAMQVAGSLTMSVLRVAPVPRMPSPEAYDATLRGRALRQQATEASLARARDYFEQAIALDPTYAPAHAGLADVYHVLGGPGWELERPRDALQRAMDAASRAIALDPRLPDGYAVRGMCRLWRDGDTAGAEDDLRRAVQLNASYALGHQYLSTVLVVTRRPDEAIAAARRAAQLDPLSPTSGTTLAYRLYYAGRFADAVREFDRALEAAPAFASAWLGKSQALRALGRVDESRTALDAAERVAGGRTYVRAYRGYSLAVDGDRAGALAIQRELEALAGTLYVSPFHLALVAAGLGDRDAVVRHLDVVTVDGSGWALFVPLERELAPFRADLTAARAGGSRESR
jgi:TolB-like protein/DNA-binding winged helix-turn-helix (wHTH) protein/Flp pilus assembly protein TadD